MEIRQHENKAQSSNEYDISSYVKSARRLPLLTREQETEVAIKAVAGDQKAINKLIEANLLLVVKIAHEYKSIFNNLSDLTQEGNVGLLSSLKKYDPTRGYRFSTYGGWWARAKMLRYMFNNSHMIKPGTTNEQKKLFYNLRKEQKRLEALGIEADATTIAKNLDVSEADVIEMDTRLQQDLYLDSPAPYTDDDYNVSLMDSMISPETSQPDVIVESDEYKGQLNEKLDAFAAKLKNDRHREIFYKRIIAGDDAMTLQALADEQSLSKERVRQIQDAITIKLRKYLKKVIER